MSDTDKDLIDEAWRLGRELGHKEGIRDGQIIDEEMSVASGKEQVEAWTWKGNIKIKHEADPEDRELFYTAYLPGPGTIDCDDVGIHLQYNKREPIVLRLYRPEKPVIKESLTTEPAALCDHCDGIAEYIMGDRKLCSKHQAICFPDNLIDTKHHTCEHSGAKVPVEHEIRLGRDVCKPIAECREMRSVSWLLSALLALKKEIIAEIERRR